MKMNRSARCTAAIAMGLFFTPIWSDLAFAERRIALVIGNSAYHYKPFLPNTLNDAQAMAAKFKEAGFDVVSAHNDLGYLPFKRAIRQFEDAAAEADIAVVFYAGHGIEIGGVNYMLPVDARLANTRDAHDEAITLDRLLEAVEGAKRLSLIILDACRENPFVQTMKRPRTAMMRTARLGLGAIEPTAPNMLVAYAAKAGTAAEDGIGDHSPFTAALLNHLFVPGLDVRIVFGRVRDEVLRTTGNRQEPFVYGSIGGDTISIVPAPAQAELTPADRERERRDYELVEKIGTARAWEAFLSQHPTGFYAELARQQLDKLTKLAALEPSKAPSASNPPTEDQVAWDRIRDSGNPELLRDFIKDYPASPLANTAQTRLQALERAALEREERSRVEREAQAAEVARQEAEREAAVRREEEERKATAAAEVERLKAKHEAALKREEEERKPNTAAEHERQAALPPEEREGQTNAELVRSAQTQLARLGCFDGGLDGNLNTATKTAVARYQMLRGQPTGEIEITDDFVLELANQSTRVCPLVCPAGQVAEGEVCVATQTEPASRPKDVGEGQRRLKARLDESRLKQRPTVARQREPDDDDDRPVRRERPRQEKPKPATRVTSRGDDTTTTTQQGGGRPPGRGLRPELRAQRRAESPGWGSGLRRRSPAYCGDTRC